MVRCLKENRGRDTKIPGNISLMSGSPDVITVNYVGNMPRRGHEIIFVSCCYWRACCLQEGSSSLGAADDFQDKFYKKSKAPLSRRELVPCPCPVPREEWGCSCLSVHWVGCTGCPEGCTSSTRKGWGVLLTLCSVSSSSAIFFSFLKLCLSWSLFDAFHFFFVSSTRLQGLCWTCFLTYMLWLPWPFEDAEFNLLWWTLSLRLPSLCRDAPALGSCCPLCRGGVCMMYLFQPLQ